MTAERVEKKIGGVNRTVLAREMGVTRNHVSQVLNGRSVPSFKLAGELAGKLGVSLDELWGYFERRGMGGIGETVN